MQFTGGVENPRLVLDRRDKRHVLGREALACAGQSVPAAAIGDQRRPRCETACDVTEHGLVTVDKAPHGLVVTFEACDFESRLASDSKLRAPYRNDVGDRPNFVGLRLPRQGGEERFSKLDRRRSYTRMIVPHLAAPLKRFRWVRIPKPLQLKISFLPSSPHFVDCFIQQ
ncbi:MAG TPA: hypothetical protein VGI79_08585 [Caulobacteraceae bacterium]